MNTSLYYYQGKKKISCLNILEYNSVSLSHLIKQIVLVIRYIHFIKMVKLKPNQLAMQWVWPCVPTRYCSVHCRGCRSSSPGPLYVCTYVCVVCMCCVYVVCMYVLSVCMYVLSICVCVVRMYALCVYIVCHLYACVVCMYVCVHAYLSGA